MSNTTRLRFLIQAHVSCTGHKQFDSWLDDMPPHIRSLKWNVRWVPVPTGEDNDLEGSLDDVLAKEESECDPSSARKDGFVPMFYLDPVEVLQSTFSDPDLLEHIIITPYRTYEGSLEDGIPKDPSDRRIYDEVYSGDYAWQAQVRTGRVVGFCY